MIKGEITRATILKHAVSVASVLGLDGLTIGRLAERSGLSKSGLFAHFGSKEALQHAVLESVVDRLPLTRDRARATRGDRRRAPFASSSKRWLQWAAEEQRAGGCPCSGASTELDDRPGSFATISWRSRRLWLDCIAKIAQKAIEERELRADLDVGQFAFELNSIGLGFNFAHRLLRRSRQRATARCTRSSCVCSRRRRRSAPPISHFRSTQSTDFGRGPRLPYRALKELPWQQNTIA
jgi:AcrR family transcriptional regulator